MISVVLEQNIQNLVLMQCYYSRPNEIYMIYEMYKRIIDRKSSSTLRKLLVIQCFNIVRRKRKVIS